jgi:hypothetical protein
LGDHNNGIVASDIDAWRRNGKAKRSLDMINRSPEGGLLIKGAKYRESGMLNLL